MPANPLRQYRFLLLLAVAIFFTAWSCAPESCYENTLSSVRGGFYKTGTGQKVMVDSVSIFGQGYSQQLIYDSKRGLKDVSFPLNPALESSTLIFRINDVTDTVIFSYSSYPHLISKACGYSMYHNLDKCFSTHNIIDTIIIRNRNISVSYEENIRIFLDY